MNKKTKIADKTVSIIESFVAILFLIMVLIVFVNVIGRFFFHAGITESEELAKVLFVWISFIGTVLCYYKHKHICVDILVNALPRTPRKVVDIISGVLQGVILAVFFYYSIAFVTINRGSVLPLTRLPVVLVQGILPASLAVMFVMNLVNTIRIITGKTEGGKTE